MPIRRMLALLFAVSALASALIVSACGGDDQQSVEETLDSAFTTPVGSADVGVTLEVAVEGSEQFAEPISIQLQGPYRSGAEDSLPSFDFDLAIAGAGAAVPPLGLVSTGDNVFVELQGTAYEVGEDIVSQALAQQDTQQQGLEALGIDPREWIVGGEEEGTEEVAGVETTHVSGSIDVPAFLADINTAAQNAPGGVAGQPAPELTPEQLAQVEEVIGEPQFDVFTGTDDDIVRRMTAVVDFTVPTAAQTQAGGVTGGSLNFSIEFANVGGDQEITVPPDPRPIEELAQELGGLSSLLGGGGVPGLTPDSGEPTLPSPEGGAGQPPGAGGIQPSPPGGGAGSPDEQQFREYGQCVQQADPEDQSALQRCNKLLAP